MMNARVFDPPTEALLAAEQADLRYVCDRSPGIRREGTHPDFVYVGCDGKEVRDADTLGRIKSLAVPPAWTDVWICTDPDGHIQATGRDAKGRKQYRYHPRWRAVRDDTKFYRMTDFARALPRIRERIEHDLALPGLPREKVIAAVVRLLETTLVRVGNSEYASKNDSYGLTTLRDEHAAIRGSRVRFAFRGKSGIVHERELSDARLAKIVKRCQDLPGQDLFQYVDEGDGEPRSIGSADVNAWLRETTGQDFTAKDFRTWAGTLLAFLALRDVEPPRTERERRRVINAAIDRVAERLGNTRAVCRKSYVHPAVIEAFVEGSLVRFGPAPEEALVAPLPELEEEEKVLLSFLRRRAREKPQELDELLKRSTRRARRGRRASESSRAMQR